MTAEQYLVSRFRNSLITPASLTRLAEGSRPLWKGVGFGVSEAKGNFAALPAVPEELATNLPAGGKRGCAGAGPGLVGWGLHAGGV
jgi:hypothetical protein